MPFSSTANYCKQNWGKTTWIIILLNKHFQTMTTQMFLSPSPAVPKTATDFEFETNFLKNENLFQKTGVPFFIWKIENATFPYKVALSEANETNRMSSTKWTYHEERSFANNNFLWKFCFCLRTSYKELICCTNWPNTHIHTFCKCWSFLWRCFLPIRVLK